MTDFRPRTQFLIIEHDPSLANLIMEALVEHFGSDCAKIIHTFDQSQDIDLNQFDVVLCNIGLRGDNGLTVLRTLLSRRHDLPVIMITSEEKLSLAIDAIRTGAYDFIVQSPGMLELLPLVVEKNLEISRIKRENHRLQQDLSASVDRVRESNARLADMVLQLEDMASTDALTGLRNRRHLPGILQQMLAESDRYETDLSCIMIDLDNFKYINDTLGHQQGDAVLVSLGEIIQRNVRKADVAVRFGGDECIILMPQTDGETAAALVERIAREFAQAEFDVAKDRTEVAPITLSVGISSYAIDHPRSGDELIAQADRTLYAAKEAGKNRIMLSQGGCNSFREINPMHDRRASA